MAFLLLSIRPLPETRLWSGHYRDYDKQYAL